MKKVISLLLSLLIAFGSFSTIALADEIDTAYDNSLAVLEVTYDYLNNHYLNNSLSLEYEYLSLGDEDIIENMAFEITSNCDTDAEKCEAIYQWVEKNVAVSLFDASYFPIDVANAKTAVCSGCSRLMVNLFRACDIPSAVIRCYKCATNFVTMEHLYKNGASILHEFAMAYIDGEWTAFDRVWNANGITKDSLTTADMVDGEGLSYLADQYFILNIDGVTPYAGEEYEDLSKLHCIGTVYHDGQFDLTLSTKYASNFQVGGGLCYRFYFDELGLIDFGGNKYKFVDNTYRDIQSDIVCVDGKYYAAGSWTYEISEKLAYRPLKQGNLSIHNGDTLTITDLYFSNDIDQHTFGFKISNDYYKSFFITDDGSVSVNSDNYKSNATISLYRDGKFYKQVKIFLASEFNSNIQDLCDHVYTFENGEEVHCCYCNAIVVEEEIVEEEIEEVVDVEDEIEEELAVVETPTDVITNSDIEEEIIVETNTDVVSETNVEVTFTDVEEVTITDLATETNTEITFTDVVEVTTTDITSTDVEEEVITETDVEEIVITETNVIEEITSTDTEEIVEETVTETNAVVETPVVVVTETNTVEVETSTDVIIEVETNTDLIATIVSAVTNSAPQAPVYIIINNSGSGSSGGSGSSNADKIAKVVKQAETTLVEEKTEIKEFIENRVEEIKSETEVAAQPSSTATTNSIEINVDNLSKEETKELAASVIEALETLSVAFSNAVKTLNKLFAILFK